ncbi:MAG: hypothetical protein JJT99_10365, partial [Rhodobacteraceae bacterium]|nr:hypothetical protein [Paracoccaceae bacterium]
MVNTAGAARRSGQSIEGRAAFGQGNRRAIHGCPAASPPRTNGDEWCAVRKNGGGLHDTAGKPHQALLAARSPAISWRKSASGKLLALLLSRTWDRANAMLPSLLIRLAINPACSWATQVAQRHDVTRQQIYAWR